MQTESNQTTALEPHAAVTPVPSADRLARIHTRLAELLECGEISPEAFAEYSAVAHELPTAANTSAHEHNTAPTQFVEADGVRFAYRRFGEPTGTPIVLLQHFMGNLDNYDPAVTDALAMGREVILTDNAGVGLSTGTAPNTVAGMARDTASLIDALQLEHIDLFGFSMGGHVAQQIAVDRPELVRRLVLVGTGPRGGDHMDQLAPDVVPLFQTAHESQDLMWLPIFFSPSEASQAAGRRFLERVRARAEDRDLQVSDATIGAHLAAAREWGVAAP